eukprot:CAMPEP_0201507188 /NCGR_PEP_ID=MMETSP0161_2-20130828/930_1 /ASSEMBLY_ACC=CAM_ASM_000251 /TAXON_ID=180227 /ORGANISM="Neoparamoeba aestuarina, Strain SoJaBio B1-5/56/2" /LENGTH=96 /DNA_ID=CAMNT_0047901485 /DNA_START=296 /DNA_END=586 /DNA_ORIENTATION=+
MRDIQKIHTFPTTRLSENLLSSSRSNIHNIFNQQRWNHDLIWVFEADEGWDRMLDVAPMVLEKEEMEKYEEEQKKPKEKKRERMKEKDKKKKKKGE